MTAIYALPDHEVVADLLPELRSRQLDEAAALARIQASPGVVPVAIDHQAGQVYWADLGDHPFREWQFLFTVEKLARENAIADAFTSPIALLADRRIAEPGLAPQGFIFHVSRCGSTLLGKAIARLDENVVINQGGPLQRGFWAVATDDWRRPLQPSAENLEMFRNLVLAMTRPRAPGQRRAFVKFISWNALYIDFVMRAFPGVPCLFLYRDPVEVIASVFKETTAALVAKGSLEADFLADCAVGNSAAMSDVEYLAHCYAHYFRTALALDKPGLHHLNYTAIKRENLATILSQGLAYVPEGADLDAMAEQFRFHSKDDSDKQAFRADSAEKQAALTPDARRQVEEICGDLVEKLDKSSINLFAAEALSVE